VYSFISKKSVTFSIDNNFEKTDEALERFIESMTKMVSSTNNIIFLLLMKVASVSVSNTLISGIVMESCEVHGSCSLSSYESSRFLLRVAIRSKISYLSTKTSWATIGHMRKDRKFIREWCL
jgi:hypothetical protein